MKQFNGKRYYSLDTYLKEQFGEKVYKLSLNGGMTCPNRDGTIGTGGCIFCSKGGSGDFAADKTLSISDQIQDAKKLLSAKISRNQEPISKYIAYFQAYTNTYAPISYLRRIFYEAIETPDIAILSIATRPDCLGEDILLLLDELNQIKPVWVELGLQSIHEDTAHFIQRGYSYDCFETAVKHLHNLNISVIPHIIIGLPYLNQDGIPELEDEEKILETIRCMGTLPIQGIKLQLLHILKNTVLYDYWDNKRIPILTLEQYTELIVKCIEHLPAHIVIHRLTGDGPRNLLSAPKWSENKINVLNRINHLLKVNDTWQGKFI